MTLLDQYLIVGFITALFVGYIVYKMIKGILGTMGRFGYPHQYPMPISAPVTTYSREEEKNKDNTLVIALLVLTIGFAAYSLSKNINFEELTKPTTPEEIQKSQINKDKKEVNTVLASFALKGNENKEWKNQEETKKNGRKKINHSPRRMDFFYLQVKSSNNWEAVLKKATDYKYEVATYIGVKGSPMPYKILLGPFSSRQVLEKFKSRNNKKLEGAFTISSSSLDEIYSLL